MELGDIKINLSAKDITKDNIDLIKDSVQGWIKELEDYLVLLNLKRIEMLYGVKCGDFLDLKFENVGKCFVKVVGFMNGKLYGKKISLEEGFSLKNNLREGPLVRGRIIIITEETLKNLKLQLSYKGVNIYSGTLRRSLDTNKKVIKKQKGV